MEEIEKNERNYILAVDCGSTNIVASIFDLKTNLVADASNKVLFLFLKLACITFLLFNSLNIIELAIILLKNSIFVFFRFQIFLLVMEV